MENTRSKATMENASGTYEKQKKQRKMKHQTDDYGIQTPNEPRLPPIPPRPNHWPPSLVISI